MRAFRLLLGAVMAILALAIAPPVARADQATCFTFYKVVMCDTRPVAANRQRHFVWLRVSAGGAYWTEDVANGYNVAHGYSIFGVRRTVFGLYSQYKLHCQGPAMECTIGNT